MSKASTNGSIQDSLINEGQKLFGGLLLKSLDNLSKDEESTLGTMIELEKEAKIIGRELADEAPNLAKFAFDSLISGLEASSELNTEQKESVQSLFSQTVMLRLQSIPNALHENLKEGKGLLFNSMLNETAIDILQSILDFKKSIDQNFPGLSDTILKIASVAITAAVTAACPAAGVALKATGILDKAADFLKTDNLEKTVGTLKTKYAELEKDKQLEAAAQRGGKISEASKITGIAGAVLNKIGIPTKILNGLIEDAEKVPEVKEFMGHVAEYSENILPASKQAVHENIAAIKGKMMTSLKESGLSEESLGIIEKKLDKKFEQATKVLEGAVDNNKDFFDKLIVQQEGGKALVDIAKGLSQDLKGLVPNERKISSIITKVVAEEVKARIQGPIETIQQDLKKRENVNLSKELGANLRSTVAMDRTATEHAKSTGQQINAGGRGT